MRLLKRWRCLLIAIMLMSIGGVAVAHVRSPRYRAAQAYGRIPDGMNLEEAEAVLSEWGGQHKWTPGLCGKPYQFGGDCFVSIQIGAKSDEDDSPIVYEKYLIRPTFARWLFKWLENRPHSSPPASNRRDG